MERKVWGKVVFRVGWSFIRGSTALMLSSASVTAGFPLGKKPEFPADRCPVQTVKYCETLR